MYTVFVCFELQTLSAYWTHLTEWGVLLGGDRHVTQQSMLNVIKLEQRIAEVRTRNLFDHSVIHCLTLYAILSRLNCSQLCSVLAVLDAYRIRTKYSQNKSKITLICITSSVNFDTL